MRTSRKKRRRTSRPHDVALARVRVCHESATQTSAILLDIHQLAEALAVGRTTIENWTRSRRIPSLKIGRVLRYDLQKVLAALAAYERKAIQI